MKQEARIPVLDGWRGISILLVLSAHLMPLGPKAWQLNYACGILGMAIFFTLSGFLITSLLLERPHVLEFLARRFVRIVPLAWLYLVIALLISGVSADSWFSHFLFYANLPPSHLVLLTDHMWSVCVEVQFYLGIAALVALLGSRGIMLLPLLCILVTVLRMMNGVYASSVTYFRFDEILAGCTLALVYHGRLGKTALRALNSVPHWLMALIVVVSCLKQGDWLNYFRPYFAAMLVGMTIVTPQGVLAKVLRHKTLAYVAAISYALYVIHPLLAASWLGSGDILEKYAKRPLLFLVLFAVAHFSTYCYERKWIEFGRRLTKSFRPAPR